VYASGPSAASHGTQLTASMRVDVEYRFGTIPRIVLRVPRAAVADAVGYAISTTQIGSVHEFGFPRGIQSHSGAQDWRVGARDRRDLALMPCATSFN
jgi:hypothetical protein